jgi:hypothetical protein
MERKSLFSGISLLGFSPLFLAPIRRWLRLFPRHDGQDILKVGVVTDCIAAVSLSSGTLHGGH